MKISFDSIKPVYLQIAEAIEDDILYGKLNEGDNCYSQLIIAKELNINPATAAKGINLLVQKGILEKQRGLSMTIASGAQKRLLKDKKEKDIYYLISNLIIEAQKVNMSENELIKEIKKHYSERGNNNE